MINLGSLILLILGAIVAVVGAIVGYVVLYVVGWPIWYSFKCRRRGLAPPSYYWSPPLGIPMARNLIKMAKADKLMQFVRHQHFNVVKKTTFIRQTPLEYQFVTIDPDNIKTVLATSFKDYSLGIRYNQIGPIFGDGIFTLSGEGWKHSRAMLRPQFSRDQVSRLDQVSHHADVLISAIKAEQQKHKFIDLQRYFHMLTMDTATEFLFGSSIGSLTTTSSGPIKVVNPKTGVEVSSEEFVESYTFLNRYALKRMLLNWLYWTQESPEYHRHRQRAREFIDHYVYRALDATQPGNVEKLDDSSYVFSYELAKATRDPIVIRDQIFNILIAGRDTTASTLSFVIYYLAHNSRVLDKLKAELLENFGTLEEKRSITYEMLRQSKYLNQVINETLRIAPIVPLNSRRAIRDTVIPHGGGPNGDQPVLIPKNSAVFYSAFNLHRNPQYWGDDVETFLPERWDRPKYPSNPWTYLPFNGGPRICLGQQFALTEIALTIVRIFQHFDTIEAGPDLPKEEPGWNNGLTLQQRSPGLQVRLVESS